MKKKIYLDTSVISYLTANPSSQLIQKAHQQITRLWWNAFKEKHEFYLSAYVIEEIEKGHKEAAKKRLEAIEGLSILGLPLRVEPLAKRLLKELGIPDKARLDGYHLAIAALSSQDYIVSWNFKHMANANVRSVYKAICLSEGLVSPEITTPEEMLGQGGV